MQLSYQNVEQAFYGLVEGISENTIPTVEKDSRNGPVISIPQPVVVTVEQPRERVLFNPARHANPFFHVVEALWMLAGRNTLEELLFYNKGMAAYSDDNETLNGAYGYRWRQAELKRNQREFIQKKKIDQLAVLIEHLERYPDSRRAVLSMWNVEDDLVRVDDEADPLEIAEGSKDVCCNLNVVFKRRKEQSELDIFAGGAEAEFLDMTVFNRSNDIIWGMLGANAVHFTFLQEYLACQLGLHVGVWHQVSADAHIYEDKWKPEEWLKTPVRSSYPAPGPLVSNVGQEEFDVNLNTLFDIASDPGEDLGGYSCLFIEDVARPMMNAWRRHKARDYSGASIWADQIQAQDWQLNCKEWLDRTQYKYLQGKKD